MNEIILKGMPVVKDGKAEFYFGEQPLVERFRMDVDPGDENEIPTE